jgi:hypothetical protein
LTREGWPDVRAWMGRAPSAITTGGSSHRAKKKRPGSGREKDGWPAQLCGLAAVLQRERTFICKRWRPECCSLPRPLLSSFWQMSRTPRTYLQTPRTRVPNSDHVRNLTHYKFDGAGIVHRAEPAHDRAETSRFCACADADPNVLWGSTSFDVDRDGGRRTRVKLALHRGLEVPCMV